MLQQSVLASCTPLLDPRQLFLHPGDIERRDALIGRMPIDGLVDQRNRDRRTRAAIHAFLKVPEHYARSRYQRRSTRHDFEYRQIDVAFGDDGA